jgi:hypothetical protein
MTVLWPASAAPPDGYALRAIANGEGQYRFEADEVLH